MTRLLVSVRDAREAEAAVAGGADVVDVKEPHRGALGCALPTTWHAVADALPRSIPLSIALGELESCDPRHVDCLPSRCVWAKVGLAGLADDDWETRWQQLADRLPTGVTLVAVAYADWEAARAPQPQQVLHSLASRSGTMLLDTHTKDGRTLVDWCPPQALTRLVHDGRALGVKLALAGSLGLSHLPLVRRLRPDWLAVRGAVCRPDRCGTVDTARVADLRQQLATQLHAAPLRRPAGA